MFSFTFFYYNEYTCISQVIVAFLVQVRYLPNISDRDLKTFTFLSDNI